MWYHGNKRRPLAFEFNKVLTVGELNMMQNQFQIRGSRGCYHMVVGFITTYAISAYHH
jgi:hypothetical protein